MAVLGGLTAYQVFGTDYLNGMLVAIIFYLASYYLARYLWFRELNRDDVSKIYSTGIGGFVLVFLFTWILLFTLASA
ncbi:MAG TPA: hypothetical protein VEC08_02045 [Nitrososphaerales archaeon]|nr:hypothetical protein [Nitrososphaerales archaeon]